LSADTSPAPKATNKSHSSGCKNRSLSALFDAFSLGSQVGTIFAALSLYLEDVGAAQIACGHHDSGVSTLNITPCSFARRHLSFCCFPLIQNKADSPDPVIYTSECSRTKADSGKYGADKVEADEVHFAKALQKKVGVPSQG
jgi:hypothetical protein